MYPSGDGVKEELNAFTFRPTHTHRHTVIFSLIYQVYLLTNENFKFIYNGGHEIKNKKSIMEKINNNWVV